MRSAIRLILAPTMLLALWGVSGCGEPVPVQSFPRVADLRVEPKPVPGPEIVTSAQASAQYDAAVEAWGERGWLSVGRLCRWARDNGMTVDCPD